MFVDLNSCWRQKALALISHECARAYAESNAKRKGKRHVPYGVPEIAAALIKALDKDDESEVKRLFIIQETCAYSLI